MLYLVRVGKNTRRGGFQELHSFAVDIDADHGAVIERFQTQYDGFAVSVEKPKVLTLDDKPKGQDYLTDVLVDYADKEREIAESLHRYESEADQLRHELYEKITERFRSLSYTDIESDTKLLIYTHVGEAWIRRLPIYGAVFARHVSNGKELPNEQEDANESG